MPGGSVTDKEPGSEVYFLFTFEDRNASVFFQKTI